MCYITWRDPRKLWPLCACFVFFFFSQACWWSHVSWRLHELLSMRSGHGCAFSTIKATKHPHAVSTERSQYCYITTPVELLIINLHKTFNFYVVQQQRGVKRCYVTAETAWSSATNAGERRGDTDVDATLFFNHLLLTAEFFLPYTATSQGMIIVIIMKKRSSLTHFIMSECWIIYYLVHSRGNKLSRYRGVFT